MFSRFLNAAVLAGANLTGVVLGFFFSRRIDGSNRFATQLLLAIAISVALFLLWDWFIRARDWRRLHIRRLADAGWVFGLALVWSAVLFVPLHLLTQGYMTALNNVFALWAYQAMANLFAIGSTLACFHKSFL